MRLIGRRWSLLLTWVTLLGLVGCGGRPPVAAQAPTPIAASPESAPETPARRGIFYVIRGKTATVFLLGSVHVGKQQFYPLDGAIEAAFAKADTLILEIDLRDKEALEQQVGQAGIYPPGDSVENHVDPEVFALLRAYAAKKGMALEGLSRLKPWTISLMVIAIAFKEAGYAAEHGIDLHFAERAGTKAVGGLETVAQQLSFFTSLDDATQNLMLRQVLEESAKHATMIDRAAVAWLAGDEARLDQELLQPLRAPEYGALFDKLFTQRNVAMADALEGLLTRPGTHFVVVGAGHVIGKKGIVDLLRTRGHTVERE